MSKYLGAMHPRPPANGQDPYHKPKRPWPLRALRTFGRIIRGVLVTLGTISLMLMLIGAWSTYATFNKQPTELPAPVASGPTVLFWPMETEVSETPQRPTLTSPFGGSELTTRSIADRLYEAANDKDIRALYVSYRGAPISLTQVEEWRPALQAMKKAGKKLVFYATDLGMGPGGMDVYLLASEFDKIAMMPAGAVSLTGMAVEMPFARDVLDRLGVVPQIVQRKEYKTAFENITASHMSDANREMTSSLVGTLYNDMVSHMAANRKLSAAQMQVVIDRAILTAAEAKEAGLVDEISFGDKQIEALQKELVTAVPDDAARKQAEQSVGFVEMDEYVPSTLPIMPKPTFAQMMRGQTKPPLDPNKPRIALIDVAGTILLTDGSSNPTGMGSGRADAVDIVEAMAAAASDPMVAGIVLRVDSPGGSPVASEVIRNGVIKAKSMGKKVYISMGEAAASGGYWLSADADKIYALPSTMTGSIGVIGGKFAFEGIWNKLGVNWDTIVGGGKNAGMWSINKPFTPEQMAIFARSMDNTYADFTSRVAQGRKLPPAKVEDIARGRVWLGAQATQNGLVDGLKTYRQTQDQLLDDLQLTRAGVNFIQLPEPPNPFQKLAELFGMKSQVMMGGFGSSQTILPPELQGEMGKLVTMQAALQESGLRGAVVAPSVLMLQKQ